MKQKDLNRKFLNAIQTSVEVETKNIKDSCGRYTYEDFEKYWDNELDQKDKIEMESHCMDCPFCNRGLDIARQVNQIASTHSDEDLIAVARKKMVESKTEYLWAAAGDPPGLQGEALGIAIAGEGEAATLIECNAWVANALETRGTLEIWGIQVIETPGGVKTDRPLDSLEEKLMGLFRTIPFLRNFNLDRRYVNADLKERRLKEVWSLSLAVIMAIVNALYQRNDDVLTVYSADVRQDGRLEKVGYVEHKVRAGKEQGVRRFILSSENRRDVPLAFLNASDVEILFFDHLDEIVRYLRLPALLRAECSFGEPAEPSGPSKSGKPGAPLLYGGAEWSPLARQAELSGAQADFLDRLFPFLEDLCQRKPFAGDSGCCFIVGNAERICRILPPSGLEPTQSKSIFNIGNRLFPLIDIVNSQNLALVIGLDGTVHSIRRMGIDFSGRPDLSPLHGGLQRKWAAVSLLTESILFWVSPADRSVQMFQKGEFIGKYLNGRWRETRYDVFKECLIRGSKSLGISPHTALNAARSAFALAEDGVGGMVVLGLDEVKHAGLWESAMEDRSGVSFYPVPVDELTSEEMTHFAKADGAVLIDRMERIIAFGAVLFPSSRPMNRGFISLETRHAVASRFSEESGCLILVASRYGTVTLFDRGQEVICV
ncbi:MAG: diadenylate cyclase [Candidatus Aminicenantes bacterium]|nr:diadenylate cyclase [Candidatus Aminicenantes bacterium]